jgi:hypothetical protein
VINLDHLEKKDMLEITAHTKVVLGIVSAGNALVAGLAGYLLSASVIAVLSGRPSTPNKRPMMLWIVFFLTTAIALLTGSIATFAPQMSQRTLPTQEAHNIRMVLDTAPAFALQVLLRELRIH